MAGANPEGVAWFPRAALKCWEFDPDDAKQFYSHILLEIVSNCYVDEGFYTPNIPYQDLNRLGKQVLSNLVRKTYARYQYMNAMAGSTCMGTKRQDSVGGTDAYFEISDQSGKNEVGLWPCLIPTLDEQFLWVDLSYPLRCIYIPLCQEAHKRYPDRCTYTRVEIRLSSPTLEIYRYIKLDEEELIRGNYNLVNREKDYAKQIDTLNRGSVGQKMRERDGHTLKSESTKLAHQLQQRNPTTKLPITKEPGVFGAEKRREQGIFSDDFEVVGSKVLQRNDTFGWKFLPQYTARFDIRSLASMLAIPTQLRKEEFQDPYQFIALFDSKSVVAKQPTQIRWMNKAGLIQLDRLISSQYGISVTYQGNGYDKDWIVKCLMGIVAVGLSCIPMIGPLVALGSQLITDAILDPESFTNAQGLVAKIPNITTAFVATGQNTKGFLAEMKTGKSASRHVLPLESDDKQGRSIQVGPDASDRDGTSGQSDKKVDTLINEETFEIFNDDPEQSEDLDNPESKSDSGETGKEEGEGEETDGKEGSGIDGDNTSEDGAKDDPENEAEESGENNEGEEGTGSNEEGEAEGSAAQVGSDNGDNEESQDESGSGAGAAVGQDDANGKDIQEGDKTPKSEAPEEDLRSEDHGEKEMIIMKRSRDKIRKLKMEEMKTKTILINGDKGAVGEADDSKSENGQNEEDNDDGGDGGNGVDKTGEASEDENGSNSENNGKDEASGDADQEIREGVSDAADNQENQEVVDGDKSEGEQGKLESGDDGSDRDGEENGSETNNVDQDDKDGSDTQERDSGDNNDVEGSDQEEDDNQSQEEGTEGRNDEADQIDGDNEGSGEGDNPEGDNPEGDNPEGDNPEGDNPEGDNPEGDNPEGDNPEGDNPKESDPKGNNQIGNNPKGNASKDSDVEGDDLGEMILESDDAGEHDQTEDNNLEGMEAIEKMKMKKRRGKIKNEGAFNEQGQGGDDGDNQEGSEEGKESENTHENQEGGSQDDHASANNQDGDEANENNKEENNADGDEAEENQEGNDTGDTEAGDEGEDDTKDQEDDQGGDDQGGDEEGGNGNGGDGEDASGENDEGGNDYGGNDDVEITMVGMMVGTTIMGTAMVVGMMLGMMVGMTMEIIVKTMAVMEMTKMETIKYLSK
ncbi:uncharacterized protein EAF02_008483 [Botrytis sinoallii]|uniref:uncharacterized protein n=1 Tax=Botrytis sinoallii TaxID=1463999 RepID=UPI001900C2ED|nr:uncharacterized protein EAF02_008483 [Botrytis sinoallii]KAF7874506.1 hypothetical protein EAF02_008483 [Botrytis sinoallii]